MKMNRIVRALLICVLCLLPGSATFAQHYELFYTCTNDSYSSKIDYLKPETGFVSIDLDEKQIIFHNLNDSQVIDFRRSQYHGAYNSELWLSLRRDAGDSWDGYILTLDDKNQPQSLSRRYTMKGEGKSRTSPKKTYYKYPPFWLVNEPFYVWRRVPAAGSVIPDLRGDEYACFKEIISTPKNENTVKAVRVGEEFRLFETPYGKDVKALYKMKLNPESIYLISKPKHHGLYFNAVSTTDSGTTFEVFYGINNHLDMTTPVLQVMVYKDNVYQYMDFFGDLYSEQRNEQNYVPYVPPVISACRRCKGTGKVMGPEICKRCNGRGHQKSTVYRSADQVIKRESHSDGSQTITYYKQGYSSNVYECDLCHGTGHKLITCDECGGTGKIKIPGK